MSEMVFGPGSRISAHALSTPAPLYRGAVLQSALLVGETAVTHLTEGTFIEPATKVMMASCSEREKKMGFGKIPLLNDLGRHLMMSESFTIEYVNVFLLN